MNSYDYPDEPPPGLRRVLWAWNGICLLGVAGCITLFVAAIVASTGSNDDGFVLIDGGDIAAVAVFALFLVWLLWLGGRAIVLIAWRAGRRLRGRAG